MVIKRQIVTLKIKNRIFFFILISIIFIIIFSINNVLGEIENGTHFTSDAPWPVYRGNPQNTGLSKFNSRDNNGTLKWIVPIGGEFPSRYPIIGQDGTVYIDGRDGTLFAINPNGSIKWKFNTSSLQLRPAVIDKNGTVYFYVLSSDLHNTGLYAIYFNGTLKWKLNITGVSTKPIIDSLGNIILGFQTGELESIYPNGSIYWVVKLNSFLEASPAIDSKGMIYIGTHFGETYSLFPNGTLNWSKLLSTTDSPICIDRNGSLYALSFSWSIRSFYPNGTVRWNYFFNNPDFDSLNTL